MDSVVAIASAVGVAIAFAIVMPILVLGQRKKLAGLEGFLRERGGMTLDEIAKALGTSFFAKGYLMQGLDQMVTQGKLIKVAPPKGHPRLRIFRDTKYQPAA
jgi:ABC-type siderophore export system fused ATPase/permease subunit